ncbi:MAG: sugar transferase [Planctomycetota bacterium]
MPFQLRDPIRGALAAPRSDGKRAGGDPTPAEVEPMLGPLLEARSSWHGLEPTSFYFRRGQPLLNLLVLVTLLPPALPIGLAIALVNGILFRDPRQIFFVQQRLGWRGRPFRLFKFRTMREIPQADFASWENGDRLRVTRFGRLLRNTHLDELPQILNVLRGEMNFIGPRPEMLEIEAWADARVPGFTSRLVLKPGLTGWAQITQGYTGHDAVAYAKKLASNEHYRRRLSLRFDLEILARTAIWMVRGRGWNFPKGREKPSR